MSVLSRREVEKIIGAIDTSSRSGLRARAALLLAYSGLTSGEIVHVQRPQITGLDRHATIHIPTRQRGQDLPIRDEVARALREWLAQAPDSQWLLCTYAQGAQGNPISDGDIRSACDRAARDAGMDPGEVNPTILRESYAWLLAQQGASQQDIAEVLGFAQLRSAERIMRAPAPDLGDRIRGTDAQPTLPARASAEETRELREQVDALREQVQSLDARDDLNTLAKRVEGLADSVRDIRRVLDAREERMNDLEELVKELLHKPMRWNGNSNDSLTPPPPLSLADANDASAGGKRGEDEVESDEADDDSGVCERSEQRPKVAEAKRGTPHGS